jgi:hypothetical protein
VAGAEPDLRRLTALAAVALGGAGATDSLAAAVGARLLTGDPVTEAERLLSAQEASAPPPDGR